MNIADSFSWRKYFLSHESDETFYKILIVPWLIFEKSQMYYYLYAP